ncbi:DUF4105 domain-containing protein [Halosquirtibacter laminarini]|uniref:DUF4105 domain-containing protein n=1 Tax=Halosquirtibacter laminarini TaxID=3374600 RepID=A0AC61NFA9_9BACT|nr:DUF4105 domain-containing protein [Prolixibacteraceae bacterium]
MRQLFICTIALFFSICSSLKANNGTSRNFYLITCEPGDEIYSLFGHSALRYQDESNRIDVVFNYGLFDFNAPNFVWNFVLGKTDYLLGYTNYNTFINSYKREGREVYQDTLNLTNSEKVVLFNSIRDNLKPQNRLYRYNYLRNNCSTKLEDQITTACNGAITWEKRGQSSLSFRALLDQYMDYNSWDAIGIYIALGAKCDQVATWNETMFLPEYLQAGIKNSQKKNQEKITKGETKVLLKSNKLDNNKGWQAINNIYVLLFIVLLITIYRKRKKAIFNFVSRVLWLVNAIASVILLFLGIVSVHPLTGYNMNLLVFSPLAFIPLITSWKKNSKHKITRYGLILYGVSVMVLLITTAIFSLQKIHIAVYCTALIYTVIGIAQYNDLKKTT